MKTMTCRQLGGACDEAFQADSFEEMGELSRSHAMEMFQQGDRAHIDAGEKMKELMQDSEAMSAWFESRRKEFEESPED